MRSSGPSASSTKRRAIRCPAMTCAKPSTARIAPARPPSKRLAVLPFRRPQTRVEQHHVHAALAGVRRHIGIRGAGRRRAGPTPSGRQIDQRERAHVLAFAVLKQLEVVAREIAHELSVAVGHEHVDLDVADLRPKRRRFLILRLQQAAGGRQRQAAGSERYWSSRHHPHVIPIRACVPAGHASVPEASSQEGDGGVLHPEGRPPVHANLRTWRPLRQLHRFQACVGGPLRSGFPVRPWHRCRGCRTDCRGPGGGTAWAPPDAAARDARSR
jgi:hypothetical protein